MNIAVVNHYLAHKQRLLPGSRDKDMMAVVRDIAALHATSPTTPHLSLWARLNGFARGTLDDALYEQRSLVRLLCMRQTLHIVPVDEYPLFFQAYLQNARREALRQAAFLFERAGLARPDDAEALLQSLHARVMDLLKDRGPASAQEISAAAPELGARFSYAEGKAYGGQFSIGTRILGSMCDMGLLARARPRGTWQSSLYEYAVLAEWLSGVDLESVGSEEARVWLVRRYLAAFGPATADDIRWWTGFTKGETQVILRRLGAQVAEIAIDALSDHWMLAEDAERLRAFTPSAEPCSFLLPALDPYVMAYPDRRRFLADEHRDKIIERAGNAVPTVWANGRIVGAWGHRRDGSIAYCLFEKVGGDALSALGVEISRLVDFLAGEVIAARYYTPFTKAMKA
jgi:hypothetical protein